MRSPRRYYVGLLIVTWLLAHSLIYGQQQKDALPTKVSYRVLSQRWLSPEESFPAGSAFNLSVRLRLSNEGNRPVYYAAFDNDSVVPLGYRFSRKVGSKEWEIGPSRGSEPPGAEFSGFGYRYLVLSPGMSIEFEAGELSLPDVERAFSVILKADKTGSPIEVVSDIYRPLRKP